MIRTVLNNPRLIRSHQVNHFQYAFMCSKKTPDEPIPPDGKAAKPKNRLNELLASMSTTSNYTMVRNIIKPEKKSKKRISQQEALENKPKDFVSAGKEVSTALGGNVKQTESELLAKLLTYTNNPTVIPSSNGEHDQTQNLNELIVGMKIDRSIKTGDDGSRADFVKKAIQQQRSNKDNRYTPRDKRARRVMKPTQPQPSSGSVNLFGEAPLGIFTNPDKLKEKPDSLTTWEYLQNRELKLAVTHPPTNYFERMILWTEQGKLWKFPIDNEQGLDEEKKVYFADHVFLEQHLESWCPKRGPIRHYMELVCVGLSKNPYITVKNKIDHINWYRDYFESKKTLLKDIIVDAASDKKSISDSTS